MIQIDEAEGQMLGFGGAEAGEEEVEDALVVRLEGLVRQGEYQRL